MAGGYQTAGERANVPGYGGWINGRGNREMTMLKGYAYLREFFERIEWWRLNPAPDLVTAGQAHCLAKPADTYVAYLPQGGTVGLTLAAGRYKAHWFNPRTGHSTRLPGIETVAWTSPGAPDEQDWVLLLQSVK
jgi:hypothetical protein